jgi:beta-lactamase superfamily II metal-dependent hydrolase
MSGFQSMEIDFLPVTSENSEGSTKSGDAIVGRFVDPFGRQKTFAVDMGFSSTGEKVLEHLDTYYDTSVIDVAVSTHPDADHINGFQRPVEDGHVRELLVHQPREHTGSNISRLSNLDALDDLLAAARRSGTTVSSPFTGERRLDGHLALLGPDKDFYEQMLTAHLEETTLGEKSIGLTAAGRGLRNLLDGAIGTLPFEETLTDLGETSPRNETSVITLLTLGDQRVMLTGDAGRMALTRAVIEYEYLVGGFRSHPLWIFQAPHHGSRRNIGPTLLNRILGPKHAGWGQNAIISAAEAAPKHPSAKVTNALARRGCYVLATRGMTINYRHNMASRPGWTTVPALPALFEGGEDA